MKININKENIVKTTKWGIIIICVIFFILLAFSMSINRINWLDEKVYTFISSISSDGATKVFKILTELGNYIVLGVVAILMTILLKKKWDKMLVWINLGGIALLNLILKNVFMRERPSEGLIETSGYSFPSGHSSVSMAFYTYLIYILSSRIKNKYLRYTMIILLLVSIIIVGTSRIYLRAHYASDVLAGFFEGIFYTIMFVEVCSLIKNKKNKSE